MATRPAFYLSTDGKIQARTAEFEWSGGFSLVQKRKNIQKLHEALGARALEVSTKSPEAFGTKWSAFNLRLDGRPLENVFQSSKTFTQGGPYPDLLLPHPREAKRDPRLRTSGALTGFRHNDTVWPLEPKTVFYDYIYCRAVQQCCAAEELGRLNDYEYFTDIEFNPKKSVNTQARSVVLVKLFAALFGEIPELNARDFIQFHQTHVSA